MADKINAAQIKYKKVTITKSVTSTGQQFVTDNIATYLSSQDIYVGSTIKLNEGYDTGKVSNIFEYGDMNRQVATFSSTGTFKFTLTILYI